MNAKRMVPWIFVGLISMSQIPSAAHAADEGFLGVRVQSIDGGLAEALNRKDGEGVLIGQVTDDSPAAKAGLAKGDIIVRIGTDDVSSPSDVRRVVRNHEAGDKVEVRYLRDGKTHDALVELSKAPRDDRMRHVRELRFQKERGYLGVVTQPLSGDLGTFFGVKDGEGALVSEVVKDSPAAKLGLKPGDVIVQVNGTKTEDPGELSRAVRDISEETSVEVVWIRDKKEKRGQAAIELRESSFGGLPVLGDLRELAPHIGRMQEPHWVDDHAGIVRGLNDDMREELNVLREQLGELKEQMKAMRENSGD
jgi:S1-C subfamily serine protease